MLQSPWRKFLTPWHHAAKDRFKEMTHWAHLCVERLEDRTVPSTFTWTGGGATTNWSDANNWGGSAPALSNGADTLVFPSNVGSGTLTANNDISGGLLSSITFSSAGGSTTYTLTGNSIQFKNAGTIITQSASGTDTINLNITQPTGKAQTILANAGAFLVFNGGISAGDQTLTLNCAGTAGVSEGDILLSGALTYAGGLTKTGIGAAYLNNNGNTYTGTVTVSAGILVVDQNNGLGHSTNSVTVSSGAALALNAGVTTPSTQNLTLSGTGVSAQGSLLAGNATFGGQVTVSAAASVAGSGTLTLTNSVTSSAALTISGTGTVVAKGSLLNFTQASGHAVTVSSGATLQVDGNSSTTDVTLGGILSGIGTVGNVTMQSTGEVSAGDPGLAGIGTLLLASLDMTAGGVIFVRLTGSVAAGVKNDTLTVSGTITGSASATVNVDMSGLAYGATAKTITVVNFGSLANNLGGMSYLNKGNHATPGLVLPGGKLQLSLTDVG